MIRVIKFNIWNFIDADDINNIVDDTLADKNIQGVAEDINYEVVGIDKAGNLKVKANFKLDKSIV